MMILPIRLWVTQSHNETDLPAEHAMNLPLDVIDANDRDSWIDHSEDEELEMSTQVILPLPATNSC
ncbi:hypothetical protein PISMIDRAFT_687751 [Pisolithus microcarpus 441]|uniref:Uncharacterized protein n=1 Tax=Pisolithus microcarpus 441 TaxID=765257 RepID=A0A0C9Z3S1_9AGAM|nr:hypothetical protein PISMIDRAFT_687751 [Pisolithus microcarpus 441]